MNTRPSFVRLDVLEFFRWVDDHKEDLSTAVSNLAKCLMLGKAEEGSYARKLLDEANEFRSKKSEAGRKGMESRWGNSQEAANGNAAEDRNPLTSCNKSPPNPQRPGGASNRRLRCPTTKEEFRQFVYEQDLNISLAEDWYAIHEARDWTDNEGGPLKNWKGALTNYCRSRENQLRSNHDERN